MTRDQFQAKKRVIRAKYRDLNNYVDVQEETVPPEEPDLFPDGSAFLSGPEQPPGVDDCGNEAALVPENSCELVSEIPPSATGNGSHEQDSDMAAGGVSWLPDWTKLLFSACNSWRGRRFGMWRMRSWTEGLDSLD